MAGTILAVAVLCATAVLGASLSRLTASPELYGDPYQAHFNWSGLSGAAGTSLLKELERDRAIDRITVVTGSAITVNHVNVRALGVEAIRGPCCCQPLTVGFRPAVTKSRSAPRPCARPGPT